MTKINKKKIEEFIRVDHAGERGAIKIYEGQLLGVHKLELTLVILKLPVLPGTLFDSPVLPTRTRRRNSRGVQRP